MSEMSEHSEPAVEKESASEEKTPQGKSPAQEESAPSRKQPPTPVTFSFVALLVVLYLLTSPHLIQSSNFLTEPFVFYPQAFAEGEWWRLITGNLVHADWHHLGNNALFILIFGRILEPFLGWRQMIILMFISGVASMGVSYFLLPSATLGASGIAYGLFAMYVTLTVLLVQKFGEQGQLFKSLRSLLIISLLYAYFDFTRPNINYWGHLGGAVSGVVYAFFFFNARIKGLVEKSNK